MHAWVDFESAKGDIVVVAHADSKALSDIMFAVVPVLHLLLYVYIN